MLDPWIIEQIRKREEDDRRRHEPRPGVEIPYQPPAGRDRHRDEDKPPSPGGDRGVVIIDL
jgi:hypothetical protein